MTDKKYRKYSHFLDLQMRAQKDKYEALTKTDGFRRFQSENQKHYEEVYCDADFQLLKSFLCTSEGEELATRIGILPIEKAYVRLIIPPKEHRLNDCYALEDGKYINVRIDLSRASKYEAMSYISLIFDKYQPQVVSYRTKMKRAIIDIWEVWRLYDELKSFKKISLELNSNSSTVRKAYYRAFQKIIGIPYNPTEHNLRRLSSKRYLPPNHCDACTEKDKCSTPCPTVLSYINQDEIKGLRERLSGDLDRS